ncbi:MAG: hypothetical protein U0401_31745 [Anaerolineae bacterium]
MSLKTSLLVIGLGLSLLLIAACTGTGELATRDLPEIRTQLLVRAPDGPLPLNKTITVKSLVEAQSGVSHAELYLVKFSPPQGTPVENMLIRSDAAATLGQPVFTAAQPFTPLQTGHYVIKVVGYNTQGGRMESETISFEVRSQ